MAAPKRTEKEARYRELIAEQQGSGLSVAGFSRARGLNEGTFAWWRSEIRRRDTLRRESRAARRNSDGPVPFAPVIIVPDGSPRPADGSPADPLRFEVVLPSGVEVRIPASADEAMIAKFLRAAAAAC